MSNYLLSLQKFIQPIPICQSEADLLGILTIFRDFNCKTLAISQYEAGWGVINSEDLLNLVAETWLGERVSLSNHSRNIKDRHPTLASVRDLKTLIKPAVIFQEEIELGEFLNYWSDNSTSKHERVYLVVDRQGELRGRLDNIKITKYLASQLTTPNLGSFLTQDLNDLAESIEAISLPGKIITPSRTVYLNQQWRTLIENSANDDVSELIEPAATLSTEANWERITKTKELVIKQSQVKSHQLEVQEANSYFDSKIVREKSDTSGENSKSGDRHNRSQSQDLAAKERQHNWHFLRIPLMVWQEQNPSSEPYSLVLATPIQSDSSVKIKSTPADYSSEILTTVSHELKSPLTGVVGLSSLLAGQKIGTLNQHQVGYVELIYRSGKKMMKTIDDLLELRTLTDATKESELESIDLESLCRHLYQKIWLEIDPEAEAKSTIACIQPNLSIELGSEIAIANKALLSSVLSHSILEAVSSSNNLECLEIKIGNLSGLTAITICREGITSIDDRGFHFMMAKYIAAAFGGQVTYQTSIDCCQLTLLLPRNTRPSLVKPKIADSSTAATTASSNLTILCLYPELEVIDPLIDPQDGSNFELKSCPDYDLEAGGRHRTIEADSLEQAHNLARIWRLDAIVLNGYQIAEPSSYLQSLKKYQQLSCLPLITLDARTTEAANQIEGLNVYPCLLPTQNRRIQDLIQVIQIAIES